MENIQTIAPEVFSQPVIFMAGPTAIGKTDLALTIADTFGCEIIGVDSMQIYRYMDIGTAKPSSTERGRVPHHLIDYVLPDEDYSVSRFIDDCRRAIGQIHGRGRLPLLVGGTGLYFTGLERGIFSMPTIDPGLRQGLQRELLSRGREVLYGELRTVDPSSAARIHPNDTYRLLRALEILRATGKPWSEYLAEHQESRRLCTTPNLLKIGLHRERDELYPRIDRRVATMVEEGLLPEVEELLRRGYSKALPPMQSLGYRHMVNFLDGQWSWGRAVELLGRDTRRYAKRQMTWFHADPSITWYHPKQVAEICSAIRDFLVTAA